MVKRDDLSGFGGDGRSGVKARKLEGMLAHLQEKRADTFVLPLGNITNLGNDLGSIAAKVGIRMKFLIVDDPPLPLEQRRAKFDRIDADYELMGPSWLTAALRIGGAALASFANSNYVAVPSPSHPMAVIGAAGGYVEAMAQAEAQFGVLPRAVYIASAAGSTVAGFALGEAIMRAAGAPPVSVVAVPVIDQPVRLCAAILARWTAHYFGFGTRGRIQLSAANDKRNIRYGRFNEALEDACRRVEQEHGLVIDPIYGGKSWQTMEEREVGAPCSARPALFWHCGYTNDWIAYRDYLVDD